MRLVAVTHRLSDKRLLFQKQKSLAYAEGLLLAREADPDTCQRAHERPWGAGKGIYSHTIFNHTIDIVFRPNFCDVRYDNGLIVFDKINKFEV